MTHNPDRQREYNRRHYQKKKAQQINKSEDKKILQSMRLPMSVVARVNTLVSEAHHLGTFPWKTMGAAYSSLIIKGLESLAGDETVDSMLPYLAAVQQTEQLARYRMEAQSAFSKTKQEISELLAIKAHDAAVRHFHVMYRSFEEMDETVWSEWLLARLREAFPALLKQKPKGIKLGSDRPERRAAVRKARHVRYDS